MDVVIRPYKDEDREFLVKCMNGMQEHIASVDPINLSKPQEDFDGGVYVQNVLDKVKKFSGAIFIAECDGKKVGCVVGIIKEATDIDLIDTLPFRSGRTLELFVSPSYREKKIGTMLMERMEKYFHDQKCTVLELGCYETNKTAYNFYKKRGYIPRNIDLYKKP